MFCKIFREQKGNLMFLSGQQIFLTPLETSAKKEMMNGPNLRRLNIAPSDLHAAEIYHQTCSVNLELLSKSPSRSKQTKRSNERHQDDKRRFIRESFPANS
ncbi:unnamed protein product [Mytilus edulis]|uniref:Uncharacterized protein n=1 Tax=Mytilus edulis TaxID=6550 RepID=A0A8S3TKF5_MYTED|nr:unnamed protein product [Mytilus edulis]